MKLDAFRSQFDLGTKILVTGHTGFKGTWLSLLLEQLGFEVCGLSLEAEPGSLFQRLNRAGKIEEKITDIRNFSAVSSAVSSFKPKLIFHLAAQPLVLTSYDQPRETFETNIMGTANILESAFSTSSVSHVSVITTDKVYKNEENGEKFKEGDPLFGKDPYSASKVGAEAAVSAWIQMKKVHDGPEIMALRAGNVIGGGDFAEYRLLPDLVRGFQKGKSVEIRNPQSTRPWQHVLDPLTGYLLAAAKSNLGTQNTAFNFAPNGESLSVKKVCDIAAETWGRGAVGVHVSENVSKLEAKALELDASLARAELGWSPFWTQEEAVRSTINWWKKILHESASPMQACLDDLNIVLGR